MLRAELHPSFHKVSDTECSGRTQGLKRGLYLHILFDLAPKMASPGAD